MKHETGWRIGDVVRKLRQEANLTLADLDALSGVHLTTIHDLEVGRTKEAKRATLTRLAGVFGLSLRELEDLVPTSRVWFERPSRGGVHTKKPGKAAAVG
jgi:transcriptional regulator with XRE-family HTH domain